MNDHVASSLLNNILETMMNNIVGPTMLLMHDNNIVQALSRQQPCNNLWEFYMWSLVQFKNASRVAYLQIP